MKRLLFLVVILTLSINVNGQRKLTLDEAISIALNKNVSLFKQKNNLQTSEASVKSSFGALLPTLGVSSGMSWNRNEYNSTITNFYGQLEERSGATESRGVSIGANTGVTLFDGMASWARLSQSKDNLEAAKLSFEKAKQDIVYNTADYFYSIISNQELLKVSEQNLNYNKKVLEQIVEKNKLGSSPLADVYTWQYNVGNAELNLINAKNNLEKAKNLFLNYLSLGVMEEYEFVDPNPEKLSVEAELSDVNKLIQDAMANRKDYLAQKYTLSSMDNGVTSAFGGYLPRLSLSGSFGTSATEPSSLFKNKTYSAGLSLSWSIFSGWSTDQAYQSAKVSLLNAQEDTRALERQIKIDVKQGISDYQAAVKAFDVAEKNLKSAEESKRINVEKYTLGSGTILEVLQSDASYLQAVQ
ncbi:MAG: hypothetical protein C0412_03020, partial [Flavobacterium sp.]|nr:hypothetical protein [Flavobacterium sp.]